MDLLYCIEMEAKVLENASGGVSEAFRKRFGSALEASWKRLPIWADNSIAIRNEACLCFSEVNKYPQSLAWVWQGQEGSLYAKKKEKVED